MTKPSTPKQGSEPKPSVNSRGTLPVLVRVTRADRQRIAALLAR